ncbi:hypothetical protein V1509DRAFT_565372, partial [Lipomyces kononenkoae]
SAQLLVGEHSGFQLIEGLQEPGVSLAFTTPCFTITSKGTEIFIVATLIDMDMNCQSCDLDSIVGFHINVP